jgi:hypothetical protein
MRDTKDIIKNIENIYGSNNSLSLLKDFERVIDELDCYVYDNWIDGELVQGPVESRYWVSCTFMWPHDQMPDPKGGMRLIDYGCKIFFNETSRSQVRRIKKPDDIRPGTRKGKIDTYPIWEVEIRIPKKLMTDINKGYKQLDVNKIDDIVNLGGAVNTQPDTTEQQVQDMSNDQLPI